MSNQKEQMAVSSPDDASSAKCLTGVLRRILCSRTLPTHPSDEHPDPDAAKLAFFDHQESSVKSDQSNIAKTATTPGVVARLMGLESMPDLTAQKGRSFGSFLRSRSVNFIDFLPQIDLTGEAQHRRVRTSVSFREAIGFDREKHDFFVVCFDSQNEVKNVEKTKQRSVVKKQPKRSAIEVSVPAKKQRNGANNNRKGNLAVKEKRPVKKPVDSKRVPVESMPNRKMKKDRYVGNNKIQPECVSILDHPKSFPTKSENSGKLQRSSKKEVPNSSNTVQKHKRKVDKAFFNVDQSSKAVEGNVCRRRKKEVVGGCGEKMLGEICRLAEEYASECWWIGGGTFKFEDSEEICMHFGQQILDVLLNDVVGELVLIRKSTI